MDNTKPDPLALDFKSDRQVPALALQLFNVMTAQTAAAQERVIEMEKARADKAEAEVRRLYDDMLTMRTLNEMLTTPKYARRLIRLMLERPDFEYDEDDALPVDDIGR